MRTLGRYELLRPLARGGMAEVYLARRRVAGVEKRLVIKRLRRERIADPRFLDLFVKEAQLSMALVQQNIVPVFDFGRVGDDVFLAMEHIDGKDLGSSLARHKGAGMPPLVAAFVAAECCHALHHAHTGVVSAAGASGTVVVHRDVTPRNVLLSWSGEVKLADFGIAAAIGAGLTGDTSLVGTPAYLAPEQARGQPVDARTDLYSLGLVLWEMLVGERVRGGNDATKLLGAAAENQLPPLPSALPPALAEVIRRATATAPRDRLDSARAMADLLDSFIIGERARHGGPAPAQHLAAWLRERWAGAGEDVAELGDEAGGAVATFLDDGAAGVLGTGTLRSMAVTAGPAEEERAAVPPSAMASAEAEARRSAEETRKHAEEARERAGEASAPAGETRGRAGEARDRSETVAARAAATGASAEAPSPRAAARPATLDDPPAARSLAPRTSSRRSWLIVGAALSAALIAVALSQLDRAAVPAAPPPSAPGPSPLAAASSSSAVPSPGGAALAASPAPSSTGNSSAPASSSNPSAPASSAAPSPEPSSAPASSSSSASATGAAPAAASSSSAASPSSSVPAIAAHRPAPTSSRRPPAALASPSSPSSPSPSPSSSPPQSPAPPAAARRAFTIGARPWAHFTIDGDARVYETPATVELTLGPHRIRYENSTLGVASEVTITVTAEGPSSHLQVLR